MLSSSLLKDIEIIDPKSTQDIIERDKVRRQRQAQRSKHMNDYLEIPSIYFDENFYITYIHTLLRKKWRKTYKRKVTEDHILLLAEPNSKYIGYFTSGTGTAQSICSGILKFYEEKGVSLNALVAVGYNVIVVNTRLKGETIRMKPWNLYTGLSYIAC